MTDEDDEELGMVNFFPFVTIESPGNRALRSFNCRHLTGLKSCLCGRFLIHD